jgi:hypothetical protein
MGHLIPAGTGLNKFQNLRVNKKIPSREEEPTVEVGMVSAESINEDLKAMKEKAEIKTNMEDVTANEEAK